MQAKQILSFSDLETLMPYVTDRDRMSYLSLLNDACNIFNINTPTRIALFFAQLEILSNGLKDISAFNENIIANNSSILEYSLSNMFYPFSFLWSIRDCNSSADVGLIGLVTKKLCGSYDKSVEKLHLYHRNKTYYK